jgi:RNA polymerase II elongation factor ELL
VQTGFDENKYKLKDRTYKELDIWNFHYPNESDRTSAIENAISAFDRQRISTSDKLWQMLNSKEEKAKGICKSRLKLQTGPQPPQIKVHASEETAKESGRDETMTGHETDRTNGRLTPTAAGAVSTKTTQSKKKSASAKSNNSTLTGRITKKTDKKAPAKPDGKYKSAEFVHDSDEDLDIPDAPAPPPPAPSKKPPTETSKPISKPKIDTKPAATKTPTATRSPAIKSQVTMEPRPRNLKKVPANSNGTSSKMLPGSRQTKPTSPTKPSPLASSPPTNASDFDNSTQNSGGQTSSSSSSPLMAQVSRQAKAKAKPTTTTKPKEVAKPTGTVKPPPNALKRKTLAEPTPTGRMNGDDIKRRRPLHSPSGTSSGSASPPLNRENRRQRLQQKSLEFKKFYSKYRALHDLLANQTDPTPSDLSRLKQMHARVFRLKEDIWDEDRRLR